MASLMLSRARRNAAAVAGAPFLSVIAATPPFTLKRLPDRTQNKALRPLVHDRAQLLAPALAGAGLLNRKPASLLASVVASPTSTGHHPVACSPSLAYHRRLKHPLSPRRIASSNITAPAKSP